MESTQHAHARAGPRVTRVSGNYSDGVTPREARSVGVLAACGDVAASGVPRSDAVRGCFWDRWPGGGQALLVGAVSFLMGRAEAAGAQGSPGGAVPPVVRDRVTGSHGVGQVSGAASRLLWRKHPGQGGLWLMVLPAPPVTGDSTACLCGAGLAGSSQRCLHSAIRLQ